ncbi:MAG: hypothetical protein MUE36_10235 [Acidimicrobiales bacterium]|nr:hypothetical protein [Acidimicrobiales bacterium]
MTPDPTPPRDPAPADADRDRVRPAPPTGAVTATDDTTGGGTHRGAPRHPGHWWAWATGAVAVVVVALLVTGVTGLSGPGALRRHPTATLERLVDAVHADAGELRTPDDCWRTSWRAQRDRAPEGPTRPIAAVDHLRSRVVVRAYADRVGRIDRRTTAEIEARLERIVAADPGFGRAMVVVEASPDGWSPLMSCPLVIRGWG